MRLGVGKTVIGHRARRDTGMSTPFVGIGAAAWRRSDEAPKAAAAIHSVPQYPSAVAWRHQATAAAGDRDDSSGGENATRNRGSSNEETWQQFYSKLRFMSRRTKVLDTSANPSYEFKFVHRLCQVPAAARQFLIRDRFCRVDPGNVEMSRSMQAAFMRIYDVKPKSEIRAAIRDIVPIILYRNTERRPSQVVSSNTNVADAVIPKDEAENLNRKKRELFERPDDVVSTVFGKARLIDEKAQAKLRWRIRMKLIRFQRKLSLSNAAASRSVLYSEADAIGYFLFRGPAIYAATLRVMYEVMTRLPWFVPKSMLDFGAGTGTSIMAVKEMFDPAGQAFGVDASARRTMTLSGATRAWMLETLKRDLERLDQTNAERKRARFMGVVALIEKGELTLDDLPADVRREVMRVSAQAMARSKERALHRAGAAAELTPDQIWSESDDETALSTKETKKHAEDDDDDGVDFRVLSDGARQETTSDAAQRHGSKQDEEQARPWWERYLDQQQQGALDAAKTRVRPLKSIEAIEPSPGMMSVAMNVLQTEAPHVSWKRYLSPDDTEQRDLVIAAFSLSEIATPQQRRSTLLQLWKNTGSVLVLIEHANLANFDLMMEARDVFLEMKGIGLWEWQPTIVGPCPHEKRCPLRHSAHGVSYPKMRVCKTEARYRPTFIEKWVFKQNIIVGTEAVSYLIIARNETVPDRADKRKAMLEREAAAAKAERDAEQQRLYEASLSPTNKVFERLSEEAMHRPSTEQVPRPNSGVESSTAILADGTVTARPPSSDVAARAGGSSSAINVAASAVDRYHRIQLPVFIPPATHKFNRRSFLDAAYALQRPVSAKELAVVRAEMYDINAAIAKTAVDYWRVVMTPPKCVGHMRAYFCTHEGDLVLGKVYRRPYDISKRAAGYAAVAGVPWQSVGGWAYLRRAREGWLWPSDVPLFNVRKMRQIDRPNTLMNRKGMSVIEATAMSYNDPLSEKVTDPPGQSVSASESEAEDRLDDAGSTHSTKRSRDERLLDERQRMQEVLERLVGVDAGRNARHTTNRKQSISSLVDARRVTGEQWTKAVKSARRNVRKGN